MPIKRIPIHAAADADHQEIYLEGLGSEILPPGRSLVNPETGRVISGDNGDRLSDAEEGMIEIPNTTWYAHIPERIQNELAEVRSIPSLSGFGLFRQRGVGSPEWNYCYWQGRVGPYRIKLTYPFDYPMRQPDVFVDPVPDSHHATTLGNGRLCLMESREWSADYSAATVLVLTIKFLSEYERGLILD